MIGGEFEREGGMESECENVNGVLPFLLELFPLPPLLTVDEEKENDCCEGGYDGVEKPLVLSLPSFPGPRAVDEWIGVIPNANRTE